LPIYAFLYGRASYFYKVIKRRSCKKVRPKTSLISLSGVVIRREEITAGEIENVQKK